MPRELELANTATEAATAAGLAETYASGYSYMAFVPSDNASATVQGEATELIGDKAALAAGLHLAGTGTGC